MEPTNVTTTQSTTPTPPPAPPASTAPPPPTSAAPNPTPRAASPSGVVVTDVDGNPIEHDGHPQIGRPLSVGDGSSMQIRATGQIDRLEKQARMTVDQVHGSLVGDAERGADAFHAAVDDAEKLIAEGLAKLKAVIR